MDHSSNWLRGFYTHLLRFMPASTAAGALLLTALEVGVLGNPGGADRNATSAGRGSAKRSERVRTGLGGARGHGRVRPDSVRASRDHYDTQIPARSAGRDGGMVLATAELAEFVAKVSQQAAELLAAYPLYPNVDLGEA